MGRIQNFGSWSPIWSRTDGRVSGWSTSCSRATISGRAGDDDLVALATKELAAIGLVDPADVEAGYVVRMPKAYPVYDDVYRDNVEVIRRWFEAHAPNVHPVGRNGMHKYNNQDHSMYTAMLTVENIHGARSTTSGRSTSKRSTTRRWMSGSGQAVVAVRGPGGMRRYFPVGRPVPEGLHRDGAASPRDRMGRSR